MERIKAESSSTQNYRIRESIEDLRLKITLKRVKLNDRTSAVSSQELEDNTSTRQDTIDKSKWKCTFGWQQQISLSEEDMKVGGFSTFIDEDQLLPTDELARRITTSRSSSIEISQLTAKVLGFRQKTQTAEMLRRRKLKPKDPTDTTGLSNNRRTYKEKKVGVVEMHKDMYVVWGIPSKTQQGIWDEYVLCYIRMFEDGTLQMRPGLSNYPCLAHEGKDQELRTVLCFTSIDGDKYEYVISNLSEAPYSLSGQIGITNRPENFSRRENNQIGRNQQAEGKFQLPTSTMKQVYINGEIHSAKNFENDNLYVEYWIDLGTDWRVINDQSLNGVTQISVASLREDPLHPTCYFAFPISIELESKKETLNYPRIYFQVDSHDYWDRRRVEGYCWLDVPAQSGHHKMEMKTWAPKTNFLGDMKSFFIGATPELSDVRYLATPSNEYTFLEENPVEKLHGILNKFGFKTKTSGTLLVKLNIVSLGEIMTSKVNARRVPVKTRTEEEEEAVITSMRKKELDSTYSALHRAQMRLEAKRMLNASNNARGALLQPHEKL